MEASQDDEGEKAPATLEAQSVGCEKLPPSLSYDSEKLPPSLNA